MLLSFLKNVLQQNQGAMTYCFYLRCLYFKLDSSTGSPLALWVYYSSVSDLRCCCESQDGKSGSSRTEDFLIAFSFQRFVATGTFLCVLPRSLSFLQLQISYFIYCFSVISSLNWNPLSDFIILNIVLFFKILYQSLKFLKFKMQLSFLYQIPVGTQTYCWLP